MSNNRKENIKVFARFRPSEEKSKHLEFESVSKLIINREYEKRPFNFNYIFSTEKQKNNYALLYNEVTKDILDSVKDGYNGTIMAFGQTGSGKTHTIVNEILPQCGNYLLNLTKNGQMKLYLTAFQIYNEKISNLINNKQDLKLREKNNDFFIENQDFEKIDSIEHLKELIKKSETNRHIGSTSMNLFSSRSHAIYQFTLMQDYKNIKSVLNLVDLSGSERLKKADISNDQYNETISINLSLTTLSKCIIYLSDFDKTHIPYRESKLTKLLQSSLGGNCLTALLINVSPSYDDIEETLSSLAFGQRACKIKNEIFLNHHEFDKDKIKKIQDLEYKLTQLTNVNSGCLKRNSPEEQNVRE